MEKFPIFELKKISAKYQNKNLIICLSWVKSVAVEDE